MSVKRSVTGLLSSCKTSRGLLLVPWCRTTSSWRWKMFTLDDDLTLEVKQSIEKKWVDKVYGTACIAERRKTNISPSGSKYILSMFPYPSGRLHLGHVRVYTLGDVLARYYRMKGKSVVHPMGWDAFGLPAENAARDRGIDPEKWTRDNIQFMKDQIIKMGCSYDWEREFATCDYSYYRWNQWLFMQLFKKGLAYRKKAYVFWDPVDKTVLAEEQVDSEMRSWRSGAKVERKLFRQWFIRTAAFAKDLTVALESGELNDGWRDIVQLQKHWIGTIKGHFTDCAIMMDKSVELNTSNISSESVRLWFSNTEALSKAKFCMIKPDHYLAESKDLRGMEFSHGLQQMKFFIVNPTTGSKLPVFTGSLEGFPCVPESADCRIDELLNEVDYPDLYKNDHAIEEINSVYENLSCDKDVVSVPKANFVYYPASLKLRDWLVSRQRKWGTPIPAVNCSNCDHSEMIPFEELHNIDSFHNKSLQCPKCGSGMHVETDTLDTFFDSSWYFYRFLDYDNEKAIFDKSKTRNLIPVDIYIGGKEHATLHLYYARFMSHFLHQLKLVEVKEPFKKLIPVGVVMGETYIDKSSGKYLKKEEIVPGSDTTTNGTVLKKWEKMSKSKHNGIDPEHVINEHGIDTTRLLMLAEIIPTSTRKWPTDSMQGFIKWQTRLWLIVRDFSQAKDFGEVLYVDDEQWKASEDLIYDARNFYLKGATHCYEKTSQISVAISKLQGMTGDIKKTPKEYMKDSLQFERALGSLLICMYPIMPAFAAQLWQEFRAVADLSDADFDLNREVWDQKWPEVDMDYKLNLTCKVKGKEVAIVKVERQNLDALDVNIAMELAFENPNIAKLLSRESGEVVSFTIDPGFGAVINLRRKKGLKAEIADNISAENVSSS